MDLLKINKDVIFKEDTHQYFFGDVEFTSVSRIIDNYKPKFDENGHILRACAKRDNLTTVEVQEKWTKAKIDGQEKGKRFHKQIQYFIENGEILNEDYKDVVEKYKLIKPTSGKLYPEIPLHNSEFKIAGTADLILLLDKKNCELMDWKTNKEINKRSKYGNKLLYPLEKLDNCEINNYGIQLNLYKFMLEEFNYKVNKITLFHINPETRNIDSYDIRDMQKEVKSLLNHFKKMNEW